MKKLATLVIAAGLLIVGGAVLAAQERTNAELSTPGVTKTLTLPAAADNSPIISLGTAVDPQTGKTVEGYAIIHPKNNDAKPPNVGGGKDKPKPNNSTCYAFMAKGAKWRTTEPWTVNPTNNQGLDDLFVLNNLSDSIAKWEDAADGTVDGNLTEVFGDGALTYAPLEADDVSPDGLNEVYFGDLEEPGVIGVTIVWGIFSGPPHNRELVEWDQVYDQVDFGWSATGEADKMDFENIATHELGHSFGMGHPEDTCIDETMYRFADYGETYKRDLNAGDIAGIDELY